MESSSEPSPGKVVDSGLTTGGPTASERLLSLSGGAIGLAVGIENVKGTAVGTALGDGAEIKSGREDSTCDEVSVVTKVVAICDGGVSGADGIKVKVIVGVCVNSTAAI